MQLHFTRVDKHEQQQDERLQDVTIRELLIRTNASFNGKNPRKYIDSCHDEGDYDSEDDGDDYVDSMVKVLFIVLRECSIQLQLPLNHCKEQYKCHA